MSGYLVRAARVRARLPGNETLKGTGGWSAWPGGGGSGIHDGSRMRRHVSLAGAGGSGGVRQLRWHRSKDCVA